ncbi:hypothetical protein ND861_15670 [Leptospira sp. 2 VSF19]|uniref:Uncharacterized protein n=1 Tax=Leptospira soteropolitanensis TaxID=2950025 RepID=A0AAW5VSJ0_9LEPT|nr:hypothetical protein [Leptospira soteropolitanensis]MCW7494085.1 hypothetical protein [Leptospira soteropolitanensis]MCW7501649.1 hypothetical protein [Leptospira soteropolitanensis]MCW7523931.1 hypothetical protein [Leptospira soteropolitanensis]MCW7527796.1 hypothetical protein [Leptospira soteropolitanensis]MCW7531619.1 hypothetical protein [Leptospira soteropolitanensis]
MTPEKSKYHYIKIESISDIDPIKLSISQIQQRYIDKDNNRYALRFNKDTRRIEILKLIGNHFEVIPHTSSPHSHSTDVSKPSPNQSTSAASHPTTQISEGLKSNPILGKLVSSQSQTQASPTEKNSEAPSEKTGLPSEENLMREDVDLNIFEGEEPPPVQETFSHAGLLNTPDLPTPEEPEEKTIPEPNVALGEESNDKTAFQQIEDFIKLLTTYRERVTAIIRNLQSSRIFELTGDPSENKNIVGNFAREMEAQVFEAIDKMVDLHKEMTSYPRPITYYISKAPAEKREEMKFIESDKEKLNRLHLFEMQRLSDTIVKDFKKLSLQLLNILNLKNDIQVKQLQYANQLMYVDAKNASLYFAQDLDKTILDIENWKQSK